jgi:hypothetical protein
LPEKQNNRKESMRLSRQSRYVAALIALLGVLFTQLSVAAYGCPKTEIAHAMASIAAPVAAAEHHDMPGCSGMNGEKLPLCQDHCQGGNQSLDRPALPHVSPFIAAMLAQSVSHSDLARPATTPPVAGLSLTRTTAPPLSIQNCCLQV